MRKQLKPSQSTPNVVAITNVFVVGRKMKLEVRKFLGLTQCHVPPRLCPQGLALLIVLVICLSDPGESIFPFAYFESYGWPSYGIVKPFWMTPFSDHPSRLMSSYSRRHPIISAGIVVGPRLF